MPDFATFSVSSDKEWIFIQLSKVTSQQIHIYAGKKGITVEEFVIMLISDAIYHLQMTEKLQKDLRDWRIPRLIEVIPLEGYSLKVKFEGGFEGEYDMKTFIQQGGVFSALTDFKFFSHVSIGGNGDYIYWTDEIDIRADSIYFTVMRDADDKW
jgi:hypothetical protein